MPRLDLLQVRGGTAAQWSTMAPTLALLEPGYETDTGLLKLGDGSTAWASLAAITAGSLLGSAVLPQSSTLSAFNTSDRTTNYERARAYWSGNVFNIVSENGGTGTKRDMQLVGHGGILIRGAASSSGAIAISDTTGSSGAVVLSVSGTLSASSGVQVGENIAPTINQSSSGGYTALQVNVTETATGSGAKNLIDTQVGGTSKFKVSNGGQITSVADTINLAGTKTPATSGATGVLGDHCWDTSYLYVCTATNTWKRAALSTW